MKANWLVIKFGHRVEIVGVYRTRAVARQTAKLTGAHVLKLPQPQ